MLSYDNWSHTTAGGTAMALALSALLLAGCGSEPETSSSAPSNAPSPSAGRSTASASPTPSRTSAAPASTTAAPVQPAPIQPAPVQSAPAPLTAEDAKRIIANYHQNSADLAYTVFDNGDGTFEVKVTSRSIAAQGGTGTTGLYVVEQSGSFALK